MLFTKALATGWIAHSAFPAMCSVLGGLSLFGSVVDGPLQAMLAIFGFVSTVGGAMLLLLDGHLASERDRSRRWVLAAQRALNERGALLHTEIWERIGRR
jgi:hypothetical protein